MASPSVTAPTKRKPFWQQEMTNPYEKLPGALGESKDEERRPESPSERLERKEKEYMNKRKIELPKVKYLLNKNKDNPERVADVLRQAWAGYNIRFLNEISLEDCKDDGLDEIEAFLLAEWRKLKPEVRLATPNSKENAKEKDANIPEHKDAKEHQRQSSDIQVLRDGNRFYEILPNGEKRELKPTPEQKEHIEKEFKLWERTKGQLQLLSDVTGVFLRYLHSIQRHMLFKGLNPVSDKYRKAIEVVAQHLQNLGKIRAKIEVSPTLLHQINVSSSIQEMIPNEAVLGGVMADIQRHIVGIKDTAPYTILGGMKPDLALQKGRQEKQKMKLGYEHIWNMLSFGDGPKDSFDIASQKRKKAQIFEYLRSFDSTDYGRMRYNTGEAMQGELEKEMMQSPEVKKDKTIGPVFKCLEAIKQRLFKDESIRIDFTKGKESVKDFLVQHKLLIPGLDVEEVVNAIFKIYQETVGKVSRAEVVTKFKLQIRNKEYKTWHERLGKAKTDTEYDRIKMEWEKDIDTKASAEFEAFKRDGLSKVLEVSLPRFIFTANKGELVKNLAAKGDSFARLYTNIEGMNGWNNLSDKSHNTIIDIGELVIEVAVMILASELGAVALEGMGVGTIGAEVGGMAAAMKTGANIEKWRKVGALLERGAVGGWLAGETFALADGLVRNDSLEQTLNEMVNTKEMKRNIFIAIALQMVKISGVFGRLDKALERMPVRREVSKIALEAGAFFGVSTMLHIHWKEVPGDTMKEKIAFASKEAMDFLVLTTMLRGGYKLAKKPNSNIMELENTKVEYEFRIGQTREIIERTTTQKGTLERTIRIQSQELNIERQKAKPKTGEMLKKLHESRQELKTTKQTLAKETPAQAEQQKTLQDVSTKLTEARNVQPKPVEDLQSLQKYFSALNLKGSLAAALTILPPTEQLLKKAFEDFDSYIRSHKDSKEGSNNIEQLFSSFLTERIDTRLVQTKKYDTTAREDVKEFVKTQTQTFMEAMRLKERNASLEPLGERLASNNRPELLSVFEMQLQKLLEKYKTNLSLTNELNKEKKNKSSTERK